MKKVFLILVILALSSNPGHSQMDDNIKSDPPKQKQYASNLKPGYEGSITAGYGFRADNNQYDQITIDLVNGYRILPHFYVGAGLGARFGYYYGDVLMPFYLHLKSNILNKNISPYVSLDVGIIHEIGGYGVDFYSKPSVGVYIGRKVSFIIAVGSELQKEVTGSDYCFFINLNLGAAF